MLGGIAQRDRPSEEPTYNAYDARAINRQVFAKREGISMLLPVLRQGSQGDRVEKWQLFLLGQGFDPEGVDGDFGKFTLKATLDFQKKYNLDVNGIVEDETYGQAARLGFQIVEDDATDIGSVNYPPPDFQPLSPKQRLDIFGEFKFRHSPLPDNYENIEILENWEADNIISATVPQLSGIRGANRQGTARIHKMIRDQFLGLWQAWEDAGLMGKVLTYEGAFVARFIRGAALPENVEKSEKLSNHAWGTAFDINCEWNKLGKIPALVGEKGSVRELVSLANQFGIYWGGHFDSRLDGMHFEVAILK
jgi:peptidoglycan hydrolase-like protein with peptidoglycan-binding domain